LTLRSYRSAPFQLGEQPSGDVFSSSPVKTPRTPRKKPGNDLASAALAAQIGDMGVVTQVGDMDMTTQAGEMAMTATETFQNNGDCRMMPPVSTSNALAMGPREDRIFRRSSSRYDAGGLDAQGIYPSSACVFIAK
jgi:hypothetical protein